MIKAYARLAANKVNAIVVPKIILGIQREVLIRSINKLLLYLDSS